jgi:uncharacterized membrane protein YqhA
LARQGAKQEETQDGHAETPARVLDGEYPRIVRPRLDREACMKTILRISRYFVVLAVVGSLVMFAAVTIYAAVAVGHAIIHFYDAGVTLSAIASVTVYAFKILDLFLLGTILYIVALGLAALFLDSEAALPRWFKVHELQDLKIILSQSVVVVLVVAFLGDVLEWESGTDIIFVGGGIAAVIAALAYMLRGDGR